MERHRNATKSHTGAYFKKDPAGLREVRDLLHYDVSSDEVYVTVCKNSKTAISFS